MAIEHLGVFRPGDPGWIAPGSIEHSRMISPSKVGAILGLSRWESPRSLWLRMTGAIPPEPPKDAFSLGHDAEPFAANIWQRENPGWRLSRGEVQFVVAPQHFGFPAMATIDRRRSRGRTRAVLECKIARDLTDMEKFGDDFTGDCPADYYAQVLTQMMFTGWTSVPGHLLALGPYYQHRIYQVEYDAAAKDVAAFVIEECLKFYNSLSSRTPPPLDDSVATYEAIRTLHPEIDPDTEVELDADLASEFLAATSDLKVADARARFAKTRVLDVMGRAQRAHCNGTPVARRQPSSRGAVALYVAKGKK